MTGTLAQGKSHTCGSFGARLMLQPAEEILLAGGGLCGHAALHMTLPGRAACRRCW